MKPNIEKKKREYGEKLNKIFNTGIEPIELYKKLHRIESYAHRLAEDSCNWLSMESPEFDNREKDIIKRLRNVLNLCTLEEFSIFINFDPRGYALKIKDDYVREHNLNIETDWGGYGILAPDFS